MDIKDLQNLIKFVSKSDVSEVKYKTKDFEINIKNPSIGDGVTYVQQAVPVTQQVPVQQNVVDGAENTTTQTEDESKFLTIKSPMIGTFYRRSSPDKDPFVNVGDNVSEGSVVCVIEAMKLFNQIESEIKGKIVKILVDDATPVEYDQPLFLVDPS